MFNSLLKTLVVFFAFSIVLVSCDEENGIPAQGWVDWIKANGRPRTRTGKFFSVMGVFGGVGKLTLPGVMSNCVKSNGGKVESSECMNSVMTSIAAIGVVGAGLTGAGWFSKRDIDSTISGDFHVLDQRVLTSDEHNAMFKATSTTAPNRVQLKSGPNSFSIPLVAGHYHYSLFNDTKHDVIHAISSAGEGGNSTTFHLFDDGTSTGKRSGVNGYDYNGNGGIKVLTNHQGNDYTWDDIRNWAYDFVEQYKRATVSVRNHSVLGMTAACGNEGHFQFMARVETVDDFGTNWEHGWDWCFGYRSTECNHFDSRFAHCP